MKTTGQGKTAFNTPTQDAPTQAMASALSETQKREPEKPPSWCGIKFNELIDVQKGHKPGEERRSTVIRNVFHLCRLVGMLARATRFSALMRANQDIPP